MKKGVFLFACFFLFLFFLEGCLRVFSVLFSVLRPYRASPFIFYLQLFSPSLSTIFFHVFWRVKKSLFTSTIFIPSALLQTCILVFLYDYTSNRHLPLFFLSYAHSGVISSPVLTTTEIHIFLGFILLFSLF